MGDQGEQSNVVITTPPPSYSAVMSQPKANEFVDTGAVTLSEETTTAVWNEEEEEKKKRTDRNYEVNVFSDDAGAWCGLACCGVCGCFEDTDQDGCCDACDPDQCCNCCGDSANCDCDFDCSGCDLNCC